MFLGWSSRTYPLDAADFATVEDYSGPEIPAKDLPGDDVVLLIRRGRPDALLRGREAVRAAGDDGDGIAVAYHLSLRLATIRQLDVEKVDADDLACVLALGRARLFS